MYLTSAIRPISLSHTPSSKVRYIALQPPELLVQLLKPSFFRSKNFNIFYNFEPENFSGKPMRAPTKPKKNPLEPEKIFISEVKFSISAVEIIDF